MEKKTYFICHAERNWLVLVNFLEAWRILHREKPRLILSTGAGPVVPFMLIGKLFGIPTVFIETLARVRAPSLTGRIMYRLANRFFYQWKSLSPSFPKATYGGPLL
jgi:UDP-N-acetylglucosamine:LPS N-acetylglucosamine transferase